MLPVKLKIWYIVPKIWPWELAVERVNTEKFDESVLSRGFDSRLAAALMLPRGQWPGQSILYLVEGLASSLGYFEVVPLVVLAKGAYFELLVACKWLRMP
jgi:hypothetical protein